MFVWCGLCARVTIGIPPACPTQRYPTIDTCSSLSLSLRSLCLSLPLQRAMRQAVRTRVLRRPLLLLILAAALRNARASVWPCYPGQYVGTDGSCVQCAAGTYSAKALATSCSVCAAGTYSLAGWSTCQPCPAGFYSGASATVCTACGAGYYNPSTGSTNCTACPVSALARRRNASAPHRLLLAQKMLQLPQPTRARARARSRALLHGQKWCSSRSCRTC